MISRRELVGALALAGGAAAAWPFAARAQQPDRMRRVGVLLARSATDPEGQAYVAALRRGLEQLGWTPGRNVDIELRWQVGDPSRALAFAKELVALNPDVLIANSTPNLAAARQATASIPIVFVGVADPVGQGFVASLARPGGNATGFGLEEASMGGKWLELLKEIAPGISRCTIIFNPETAPYARMFMPSLDDAGHVLTVELTTSAVRTETEIEHAIAAAGREQRGGLIVLPDSFLIARRDMIVALVAKYRLPAVYPFGSFAKGGGLISYGVERVDLFRRAVNYVDLILKGAKAADLPVQMPTKFEFAINLKTAKALGITVPDILLARADEVIE